MPITSVEFQPTHPLLLVMDPEYGFIPESMNRDLVAATESCVAVGTRAGVDGPTRVDLIDASEFAGVGDGFWVAWKGNLRTDSSRLALMDVPGDVLAQREVDSAKVFVRVIVNDDSEPDHISVVVG